MGRLRQIFDTRFRSILRDSSLMMVATIASGVLGLVQVIVVTRLLGAEGYGKLALIMAFSQSVRQFMGIRIWEWAIKEFARGHTMKDAGYAAAVVRRGLGAGLTVNALALAIVVAAAGFAASRFVKDPTAAGLIVTYGAVLLVNWTYDVAFAVLRVVGRFRFLAVQQIVMAALRIVIIGGSVVVWRRLDTTILAYVLVEIIAAGWISWVADRAFHGTFGLSVWAARRAGGRHDVHMARLVLIGSLMDTLKLAATRLDVLILGWFRTPVVVANYQAAWNFLDIANRVTQPISMVAFADLAKMGAAKQGKEILRIIKRLSALALVVMVPACLALLLLAPTICRIVYGPAYPDAPAILQVLSFSLLWLVGLWSMSTFTSVGKPRWGLEVTVIMTVIKLVLLVILTPSLGAIGVAWANLAYSLSLPLLMIPYLVRLRRWVLSPEFAAP